MNSITIELTKANSSEYLENFGRSLELTKKLAKKEIPKRDWSKTRYSARGGSITLTFSRGKIYFSDKNFSWTSRK